MLIFVALADLEPPINRRLLPGNQLWEMMYSFLDVQPGQQTYPHMKGSYWLMLMCNTSNLHGNCLLWIASLGAPLLYQPLIREIKSVHSHDLSLCRNHLNSKDLVEENRHCPKSQPTLSSFLVQSLVSLALQGHQGEVNTLPLQQFVVLPLLHSLAVFKADNHVSIFYGGQSVSDRYGGATQAYLPWQGIKFNPSLLELFPTFRMFSGLTKAYQNNQLWKDAQLMTGDGWGSGSV